MSDRPAMSGGLILVLTLASGCKQDPGAFYQALKEKNVEVLLGQANYQAGKLRIGETVKLKGELAFSEGRQRVVVHMAELYDGPEPVAQTTELATEFLADQQAAKKKYQRERYPRYEIIIEGVVLALQPENFRIILKGSGD